MFPIPYSQGFDDSLPNHCVVAQWEEPGVISVCHILVKAQVCFLYHITRAQDGLFTKSLCCCTVGRVWSGQCMPCPGKGSGMFPLPYSQSFDESLPNHCVVAQWEEPGVISVCHILVKAQVCFLYHITRAQDGLFTKSLCCCTVGRVWSDQCMTCPGKGSGMFPIPYSQGFDDSLPNHCVVVQWDEPGVISVCHVLVKAQVCFLYHIPRVLMTVYQITLMLYSGKSLA